MQFDEMVSLLVESGRRVLHVARSGPATQARMAHALRGRGEHVVLVVRNSQELADARGLLTLFTPESSKEEAALDVPAWEQAWTVIPQHPAGSHGRGAWAARIASLYALSLKRRQQGVLVSLDNFLPKLPPVDLFDTHELPLTVGEETGPELVLEQCVDWGYSRVPMVTQPGEIALRGDILDVFCPGYARPVRLEFFGDLLEEMRLFDPSSQRSRASIKELVVLPTSPLILSREQMTRASSWWKTLETREELSKGQAAAFIRAAESGKTPLLPGSYYDRAVFLEEWLPKDAVFILPSERELEESLEESGRTWSAFLDRQEAETGLRQPPALSLREPESATAVWGKNRRVHFESLVLGVEQRGEELPERGYGAFQDIFAAAQDQDRPWQALVTRLRKWTQEKRQVLLTFTSERSRAKFLKLCEQEGIMPHLRYAPFDKGLFALVAPFRRGMELLWDTVLILGEDVLQPKSSYRERGRTGAFAGLKEFDDLNPGDHLVHREYGIAVFEGLHRMELGGAANDFLLLRYAGDDKLYLPVDRLSLVQRFKGPDGAAPSLDKLGGAGWLASKSRARKAIEKIAHDLVEMYAWRRIAKGFSYSPINELYREFEASFGFEETPDQARAIQAVLADMEKPHPMDRLVCGDVGFGKTEVALRAAFRAACEGKQVALLCPTTILAEQHYQTFKSRLGGFPVNIGMLSRFVSRQKQQDVLAAAAKGQIDILIGTHRLLSDDVDLPNLALLVLDEEQRFGVRHKEKLKKFRRNVDVLTLSATPIPRTLQLSMSGIRELSVIETAPLGRKPVETDLVERDPNLLRGYLQRELARGGQVFWVHNRVEGLDRVTEFVRKLVPDARIGQAHGQMSEKVLETTMHQFWHGEMDVLVCTAIVESGLDFPRANTLIVDQAQMFGLGQLYQLRGRVGRSDVQAHAVFVVNDLGSIPELAKKRLRIILEMDYLGAGFQVAMEDLRLRGSGNILGEAQSGQMARVGLDLYLEMLEEEVGRLKGEETRIAVETELNIGVNAHIPETYITDGRERLRFYKALSSAPDAVVLQDIELEMRDRFGPIPEALSNFLGVLSFKRFLISLQVQKADIFRDKVRLTWAEHADVVSPAVLVHWVGERADRARLLPPACLEYRMEQGDSVRERLSAVREELAPLIAESAEKNGAVKILRHG